MAYHGSFRENLESAFWGLGVSYHNLIKHMRVFKPVYLKYCSFDASPQSELLITAHLERIWNQHFGVLGCHMSHHNLMKHIQVFKAEHLKCCSFNASPSQSGLSRLIRENLDQYFGVLDCRPCCAEAVGSCSCAATRRQRLNHS